MRGEAGGLARHSSINEMSTRTFEHRHGAVCGGGLFEVEVDPEKHIFVDDFFVDARLRIE